VSQLDDTNSRLDAAAARLSSLESTAVEAKQQLLEQQQAVAAATALAAAAAERSAAAEVAAATAAAGGNDGSGSSRSRSSIVAHKPCGSNAQQALLTESLTKQLADLKLQFAELSAAVSNMSRASRVAAAFSRKHSNESQSQDLNQGPSEAAGALVLRPLQGAEGVTDSGLGGDHELPPEYDESWLPFMESTSACLASHEQQLEALQSLVPKLEGVVSQRAQLINMAEQLAALQTAFNMLSHSHSRWGWGACTLWVLDFCASTGKRHLQQLLQLHVQYNNHADCHRINVFRCRRMQGYVSLEQHSTVQRSMHCRHSHRPAFSATLSACF